MEGSSLWWFTLYYQLIRKLESLHRAAKAHLLLVKLRQKRISAVSVRCTSDCTVVVYSYM